MKVQETCGSIAPTSCFSLAVTPAESGFMRTPWLQHASFTLVGVVLIGCLSGIPSSQGKIAFVKAGGLWVKALPNDKAQQIASGGHYREPRWSPSGNWLAYFRDSSQVRLMRPRDSESQVLHQALPVTCFAWSPKEDRIAYLASGVLWCITPEEHEPVLLATHKLEDGEIREFLWGAGGEWLVYSCVLPVPEAEHKFAWKQELWRLSPSGNEREKILEAAPDQEGKPGFPQLAGVPKAGAPLVFWQGERVSASLLVDGAPLYALPLPGLNPVKLSEPMLVFDDFLARSATGNFLVIVEGSGRETWANKGIVRIDLTTGSRTVLTTAATAAVFPAVSPDGKYIACVAAPQCATSLPCSSAEAKAVALPQRKIWIMRNDGSDKKPLTNDSAYRDERPLWSAKGTHILFARVDGYNRASLWLMASDGTGLTQVVDELNPRDELEPWAGYYGYVHWGETFDWWQGPHIERTRARFFVLGTGLVAVVLFLAGLLRRRSRLRGAPPHP